MYKIKPTKNCINHASCITSQITLCLTLNCIGLRCLGDFKSARQTNSSQFLNFVILFRTGLVLSTCCLSMFARTHQIHHQHEECSRCGEHIRINETFNYSFKFFVWPVECCCCCCCCSFFCFPQ